MLEARGILKRYAGVTALSGVDLTVNPGEVVALIGENGAGKSTLIKILGGLVQPDAGTVTIDARAVALRSPADATKLGIGLIHQELCNLDNLDIGGNVFLGREPRQFGFLIDHAEIVRRTKTYLNRLGLSLDPTVPLHELSIAQQQMVEIAKALSLEARFLIMDEPTSSLTLTETETLLKVIGELRSNGVGIVYVSHRLDEVKAVADRVVALRDGANAGSLSKDEVTTEAMIRLMVGRDLDMAEEAQPYHGSARLEVKGLRTPRYPNCEVSFEVGKGEIVAMAGLVGAGRTEVAQSIFGVSPRLSGSVTLDGVELRAGSPCESIKSGLFLAPEDRRKAGLITSMSVRENVTLPALKNYAAGGILSKERERSVADKMRTQLQLKAPDVESTVSGLSGGNQQKVVLARWLSLAPKCLIFDEPTRGIDVGARAEIYSLIRGLAAEGVAILMISSDMEEALGVSDRILVMHEGGIRGSLVRSTASEEAVMKLAVGNA